MRNINFFEHETEVDANEFGLCDDPDESSKTPAYFDTNPSNESKWIAHVCNKASGRIYFIAVDNKIDIRRDNGEMENRCDAILHDSDHIIFVELKNQAGNWINHAITQLATTIDVFKSVHDITMFRQRLAYACNKRRSAFAVSHKENMQRFKNKYGVRLIISCEITVK